MLKLNYSNFSMRFQDGEQGFDFEKNGWKYEDRFRTSKNGLRFFGREEVWVPGLISPEPGNVAWFMQYNGEICEEHQAQRENIFRLLRKALMYVNECENEEIPVRGKNFVADGGLIYRIDCPYSLRRFTGTEAIEDEQAEIFYTGNFIGGLFEESR